MGNVGNANYVLYNVSMSDYDETSGEPMQYSGFVASGSDHYPFTIEPNEEVVWVGGMAPPQNASHIPMTTEVPITSTADIPMTTTCDCNDDGSSQGDINAETKKALPVFVWIIVILVLTNMIFIGL